MTKDDYRHIKKVTDSFGLPICAVGSPLFKIPFVDNEEGIKQHIEAFERLCEAMHLWGTNLIRGFSFLYFEGCAGRFAEIAEVYQKIIRIAEREKVFVLIEAEPAVTANNIEKQIEFIKMVDSPHVQGLFDPGNEICDVTAPPPYPDGYEKLKPHIRHVHLKDIMRAPGAFVPAMLGEGDVDFHGIFAALKSDGYDGYVSLETHYRIAVVLDEHTLVHPQGAAFSQGGYEASVAYLDKLRDEYRWMEA
jgi:sugar phosphate isomerase/epimerase